MYLSNEHCLAVRITCAFLSPAAAQPCVWHLGWLKRLWLWKQNWLQLEWAGRLTFKQQGGSHAAPTSVCPAQQTLTCCCHLYSLLKKKKNRGFLDTFSTLVSSPLVLTASTGAAEPLANEKVVGRCCEHTSPHPALRASRCALRCCSQVWNCRPGLWKAWLVLAYFCFCLAYCLVPSDYGLVGTRNLGGNQILQILSTIVAWLSKACLKWTVP